MYHHTELLGLRSYALSMNEEIRKGMKEYNEDLLDNINGFGNDIKYGEKLIRNELADMRNDLRNQYIGLRSTMSAILSSKNRQEFTRPSQESQPYTTMMRETKEYHQKVPSKQEQPYTREYQELGPQRNQQKQGGTVKFDKEAQIGSTSAFTPDRQFHMRQPPPRTQALSHHELSMHFVKRGIDPSKDGPSTSNKKAQLGPSTMMTPFRPVRAKGTVVSPQHLTGQDVHKEEAFLGEAYGPKASKARELWPDPQPEVHDNVMPMSDEFIRNMDMEKKTSQKKRKGHGVDDGIALSDSTNCSSSKPEPRKVISLRLPDHPNSRRPIQRPGKLMDYVDPSTLAKNKCKRYAPFRPIDFSKWSELRDWYNNHDAPNKEIDGVYYNLTSPMEPVDPCWFQTIYTSKEWLGISHVNAYMYLLKGRMQKHGTSFKSNVCLFSHELGKFLTGKDINMQPNRKEEKKTTKRRRRLTVKKSILAGVSCLTPYSIVYTPFVHDHHWVALAISIPAWEVKVYDCMYGKGKNDGMDEKLREIANNMPLLLKNSKVLMEDPRIAQSFKVKQLGTQSCPQMKEVGDCGVFTLKYIEHLILKGADVKDVKQEYMEIFREKMCVDIFHKIMDL